MSELPLRTFQTIIVFVKHFYGESTLLTVPLFHYYWMASLSVAQGPCSAVLPTVHGCHYAFQKFPFFCVTMYVENSTKLTCLEITDYLIKYSTVLWLLELQISCGQKVLTQVHTVNSNSWTSNWQCSLFLKKNPFIQIFYISRWLNTSINTDKWSSPIYIYIYYILWITVLPLNSYSSSVMLYIA